MRILHVIQELGVGGAERVVLTLVEGLRASGHEVAVAAAPGALSPELDAPAFDLPKLERKPWRVPLATKRLRRAIREWKPDLIHCHNPGMAAVTYLATRGGRRLPALVSVHGVPDDDYRKASRLLGFTGLPVVACGPGVAAALEEFGLRVRATIPNGVGPAPAPADRAKLMAEWGLPAEHRMIVSVGRLDRRKNQALAVRALAEVPDTSLAILGEGALRDELARLAVQLGVEDRVVMPGNRLDARAVIGASDVLVSTSDWEGLPLVALEAMAAGTPIVATAVRGVRELLVDEVDCLLVEHNNAPALAKAIRRILEDRELAARLAGAGIRSFDDYSEESMVRRFSELYEEVITA